MIGDGDFVFLTAAISAPDVCAREHNWAWAVNVTGTSSFIQSVIDCGARVVFFSSDTVYGEREDVFDETAASNPAGEYAEMKREVEQRFAGNASFKAIRLSYVFSREDKFSRYLAGCAERNEEADLFHPFYRAIVHRDDVVEGALALAARWDEVPEQVINFGGPQVLSRIDFAECLREAHLHDLRFKVTEPGADFFKNRPRVIAMTSPIFARLLGRPPRTLREAALVEFTSSSSAEKFHD
jgi:dTDP-4-dehydrorhamnose reductase